jgi:transcriptional adapter 2-alpha
MECFLCDYCDVDISANFSIKCAICNNYDLCVKCFSQGKETQEHKNSHPYRIVDRSRPLISTDWTTQQEIGLLNGLETYGMGNWTDISANINKGIKDCRDHYVKFYLMSEDIRMIPNFKDVQVVPLACIPSHPANHEIQGYMPLRKEFETDAENEAEYLVKDLVFDDSGTELKLSIFDIYNDRLDRRLYIRQFIHERNLLDFKRIMSADRKKTKEEREFMQQFRPFAPLLSQEDYQNFLKLMYLEQTTRQRIQLLQEYRRMGIKRLKDAAFYETDKKSRVIPISSFDPKKSNPKNQPQYVQKNTDDGSSNLTTSEISLCSILKITPKAYIYIKHTLLRECLKRGGLKLWEAKECLKIDVNKTLKIYDFFKEMGWIQSSTKKCGR